MRAPFRDADFGGQFLATREEMAAELRSFVIEVLSRSEPRQWPTAAIDVFNTVTDGATPLDVLVGQVLANPLNAVAPLINAAGPPGRPLYMVHGADGEVGWFLRHLRGTALPRPVWGLVAPGWYGEPMPRSLRQLAATHVRSLRQASPRGPYTLGGYSAGAQVALEMAAQIESAGDRVDAMLLIDPVINAIPLSPADVVGFRLRQLRNRRHPVMEPYFALADRTTHEEVLAALDRMVVPPDPVSRRFYRGLLVLMAVLCAPPLAPRQVHPGRCLMLVGRPWDQTKDEQKGSGPGPSSFIGCPIESHVIPGSHARMFEEASLHGAVAQFLAAGG